jgi:hypothetical protein
VEIKIRHPCYFRNYCHGRALRRRSCQCRPRICQTPRVPQILRHGDEVAARLPQGRRGDLDDPEDESDFGDLLKLFSAIALIRHSQMPPEIQLEPSTPSPLKCLSAVSNARVTRPPSRIAAHRTDWRRSRSLVQGGLTVKPRRAEPTGPEDRLQCRSWRAATSGGWAGRRAPRAADRTGTPPARRSPPQGAGRRKLKTTSGRWNTVRFHQVRHVGQAASWI